MNGNDEQCRSHPWGEGGDEIVGDTLIVLVLFWLPNSPACSAKTEGWAGLAQIGSIFSQKPSLSPSPADRGQGLLWAPKAPVLASDTSTLQLDVVSLYISSSQAEMFLQGRHCVYCSPALFSPHLAQHSKYLNEGMSIGFFGDLELLLSFIYSLILAACPGMIGILEIQRWNVHG